MTKSMISRVRKYWDKEIIDESDLHPVDFDGPTHFDMYGNVAPPHEVGKQFPYKNAYRELREGIKPENLHMIDAPAIKSAEQLEREATYLGRNRSFPKPSTGKHGGDGTVRRSSKRKSFRGDQYLAFRPAPNGRTVSMGHNFQAFNANAA